MANRSYVLIMGKNKGYRNRNERIADRRDQAAKVWQAAYDMALGFSADPEGDAHKAMETFLSNHGVD